MNLKSHLYSIIFCIGFLLMPAINYACETKAVKSCCKSETSTKSCCNKDKSSDKESGCDGKCKNPSCQTTSTTLSVVIPNSLDFSVNPIGLFYKKDTFIFRETYISSGFYSIWSPPNIG